MPNLTLPRALDSYKDSMTPEIFCPLVETILHINLLHFASTRWRFNMTQRIFSMSGYIVVDEKKAVL